MLLDGYDEDEGNEVGLELGIAVGRLQNEENAEHDFPGPTTPSQSNFTGLFPEPRASLLLPGGT